MPENKEKVEDKKPLTLIQKLSAIQLELKAPKNQRNNFGGYNYRSAEDILEAVKPLAIKHGALVNITDDIITVGNRIYVKACVRLMNLDNISEVIETTAMAREEETKKGMDGSQITGAASSYARKYALNGMFAIDDTKDSDATNDHGKGQATAAPKTASDLLGQPKKPQVNPKYRKAWAEYIAIPDNTGVDKGVLATNFKKLCVEATKKQDSRSYTDEDWDKVLEQIDVFKMM